GVVSDTKQSVSPGVNLALGVLALIGAWVVHGGAVARARVRREEKRAGKPPKTPRWQQALSGGSARTTFLIGLVLSFPGASYLASLTAISKQGFGVPGVVVTVVAVNIVMLVLLEVPLICFFIAPEWTPVAIDRFKGWMSRNGAVALVVALTVIGVLFIA